LIANESGFEERRKLPRVIKSYGSFGFTLLFWRECVCVDSILKKSGMKRCCGRNANDKVVFIRGNEKNEKNKRWMSL